VNAITLDEFFAGRSRSREIFDALRAAIEALGPSEIRVSKSQVAFRRRRAFAWAWIPEMYLRGKHAPLVMTLALRRKDASKRWKQVVEPTKGRFTHHLELHRVDEIDAEVSGWLREAWSEAG
jgi:predicted transport protein